MKEMWCNLGGLPGNVELCGVFEFSRPKVAQIGPSRCCPSET